MTEIQARLRKVYRLADAFEKMCANCGVHEPGEIADTAEVYRDGEWRRLAEAIGVNRPSDETLRLVRHYFAERAKVAADPFFGLPQ